VLALASLRGLPSGSRRCESIHPAQPCQGLTPAARPQRRDGPRGDVSASADATTAVPRRRRILLVAWTDNRVTRTWTR
jgi:hypothetical protein